MDKENAAERQKVLMAKYYETINRFEQLKDAKRQDLRDRMFEKEQHALERRNQMDLLEKRRIILMHRKFHLENGLVRQRMRLIRMRKRRIINDEIQSSWDRHTEFRLQCRMRDEQLLALEQELRAYKGMLRSQAVQKSYERDQHNIMLTRARLILERYPGRGKEDMVQTMISEIKRLLKRQLAKEVEMARSSSQNVEEPDVTSRPSNNKSSTAVLSKTNTIKSDPPLSTIQSEVGYEKSMSGNRPKTIPYEPQHLTSEGLIDNVKGYGKLTEQDIRKAVESAYDTMISLNTDISAQQVYEDANAILLRISKGYANDIPRDEAVLECVRKRVKKMLQDIQQAFVDRIIAAHSEKYENDSKEKVKKKSLERPPRDTDLDFGETAAIGTSQYAENINIVQPVAERKQQTKSVRFR